ncbi:hypothetical protein [Parvibaculum sp.]|uniref:hypothetical protein n=1 Tax=Parvibaculum sp. TaxID=2024848 RepID=UPI00260694E2|nr:hypothetical protein [Parvibaculum sp.]MCW5726239.1 hypothetical protein [Parvibaculum sp.]
MVALACIASACDSPVASAGENCEKRPTDEQVARALSKIAKGTVTAASIWGVHRESCTKYIVYYSDDKYLNLPGQLLAADNGRWIVYASRGVMDGYSIGYVDTSNALPVAPSGKDTVYAPRKETN